MISVTICLYQPHTLLYQKQMGTEPYAIKMIYQMGLTFCYRLIRRTKSFHIYVLKSEVIQHFWTVVLFLEAIAPQ